MRKKEIEKIPWQAKPQGKSIVVEAEVVKLSDGISCIVVDVTKEKPQIRFALTQYDYANYIPAGSLFCTKGANSTWNTKNYENMNLYGYKKFSRKDELIISDESSQKISRFCAHGCNLQWCYAIQSLQREIARDKQELADERRWNSIYERMQTVPDVPKDFEEWGNKQLPQHEMAILPFRKESKTVGKCSCCGKSVEYKRGRIKSKDIVECPHCGCKATVRRVDWANLNPVPIQRFHREVVLFQKTEEGFVERHFMFRKSLGIGKENCWNDEIGRIFRIKGRTKKYFHKYSNWSGETFWDDRNLYGMYSIALKSGPVYPKTIKREMFEDTKYKYCAMDLLVKEPGLNPIAYLEQYDRVPEVEMMVKIGLKKLALEIAPIFLKSGKKPWERIGVTKTQFNRLRAMNGSLSEIFWMEFEQETGSLIDDSVISWFVKNHITPKEIGFIRDRMTEKKIMNYLKRQEKLTNRLPKELLGTWEDYLAMAKRLKMNVQQELFYKPKELVKSHDEAVKLCGGQAIAKRASEIAGKFPEIDNICQSIAEKYEFQDEEYAIVVPGKIEDIIREGRALGHCLDKSDIYFDRITKRESFIVFLRKMDDVEQPYYTLEIEPGGATRQKRTTGDKQNKDFDEAKKFIRKWQKEIQKRLSDEDRELAIISDQMRIKELAELREKKAQIWHGHLAGKLLADVLEADFMAVEEEMRRCG